MQFGKSPFIAPRLTLRVGVTGHRPKDIDESIQANLTQIIEDVLGSIADRTDTIRQDFLTSECRDFIQHTPAELRFVTGLAAGADSFSARAAIAKGYKLNKILPFDKDRFVLSQQFSKQEREEFEYLWYYDPEASTHTEILSTEDTNSSKAYVELGLTILAHSDVLIAIWNGKPGGKGGTSHVIEMAKQQGHIILWLNLDGKLQLWEPSKGAAGEWINLQYDQNSDSLSTQLNTLLKLSEDNLRKKHIPTRRKKAQDFLKWAVCGGHNSSALTPADRLERYRRDQTRQGSNARTYSFLQWVFTGKPKLWWKVDYRGSYESEAKHWAKVHQTAKLIGGDRFANEIASRMATRWAGADNLAVHYAQRYRSAYTANFLMAALAVLIGLLIIPSGIFLETKAEVTLKSILVVLELLCIGYMLWATWSSHRHGLHQRWIAYRSLAEILRNARLHVLLGLPPTGQTIPAKGGATWIIWYVRSALREIAPPDGCFDSKALKKVLETAQTCEVKPQSDYHKRSQDQNKDLEVAMENTTRWLMLGTIVTGLLFLLSWVYFALAGDYTLAKALKPWATLLGGALPVFGAALFGIRATGDFRSAEKQSKEMVETLNKMSKRLSHVARSAERNHVGAELTRLSRVLSDDIRLWSILYSNRDIVAGF